ncbi:hypothetical protein V6N13_086496 [Hibiscus sabdariffa]
MLCQGDYCLLERKPMALLENIVLASLHCMSECSYGWIQCVGIADRSASSHRKRTMDVVAQSVPDNE